MPFGFSFGKKPVVPPVQTLTAEEQQRLADEKRQLDSVIAVKNVLSSESDKSITAISNEVFGRLKNSKTERSNELTNLHNKLTGIDLGAAFHFLYTVKGAPKLGTPASYAYAPITRASVPAAATVPVQYIQPSGFQAVGPAQGFQQGVTSARNQFLASTGSGIRNVFGKMEFAGRGGAQTRHNNRNLRKRKSRTNKATRRR